MTKEEEAMDVEDSVVSIKSTEEENSKPVADNEANAEEITPTVTVSYSLFLF